MIILAYDPGYARLGWGLIKINKLNKFEILDYGLITTQSTENMTLRLAKIYEKINSQFLKLKPDIIAMEKLYFVKNQKTAVGVFQVQGIILSLAGFYDKKFYEMDPKLIKKTITGNGNASKKDLIITIERLLNLSKSFETDDVADALAIAVATFFQIQSLSIFNL